MANIFFWLLSSVEKGKTFKIKKLHKKMGTTDQPRYNSFRIIRDSVIMAFQRMVKSVNSFLSEAVMPTEFKYHDVALEHNLSGLLTLLGISI